MRYVPPLVICWYLCRHAFFSQLQVDMGAYPSEETLGRLRAAPRRPLGTGLATCITLTPYSTCRRAAESRVEGGGASALEMHKSTV